MFDYEEQSIVGFYARRVLQSKPFIASVIGCGVVAVVYMIIWALAY